MQAKYVHTGNRFVLLRHVTSVSLQGGSLCKGTSIKGSSDIDLVLMLASYRDVRKLKNDLNGLLAQLHSSLDQFPNVKVITETDFGVQIEYVYKPGDTHDVDILLAVNALDICK